jgi:hypothetical protein
MFQQSFHSAVPVADCVDITKTWVLSTRLRIPAPRGSDLARRVGGARVEVTVITTWISGHQAMCTRHAVERAILVT